MRGGPRASRSLVVKCLVGRRPDVWLRYFPGGDPRVGDLRFVFERDADRYDWLVVYDDVPPEAGGNRWNAVESLRCPRENTLLVTTEPSAIKTYGKDFTAQFGAVLTTQEPEALPHPRRIYHQAGLHWFYGVAPNYALGIDALRAHPPMTKTRLISTLCSNKRQRHTLHRRRYDFTQALARALPELDVYGFGVRPIADKAEALDAYRYHVAIENQIAPHHWTEKLSDAFLGLTLPFYCGAPNAAEYFPPESFIPIDPRDFQAAYRAIRGAIDEDAYSRRLPHLIEARERVLSEYSLIATLARVIGALPSAESTPHGEILSRHALRRRHPGAALRHAFGVLARGLRRTWHAVQSG